MHPKGMGLNPNRLTRCGWSLGRTRMLRVNVPRLRSSMGSILVAGAVLLTGCNALKLGHSTDDKTITTQIQARLFDDSTLKMRDIRVASNNGTVTLTGTVNTELEKAAAERIASQAQGVKGVVNQLVVSAGPAVEAPATLQPAATDEATRSKSLQPTAAQTERPRAPRRYRQTVSSAKDESPAEASPAPETPAENPQEIAAQAAPPAAVPASPPPAPDAPPAPAVRPPEPITVPAGTFFSVRIIDSIDSTRNRTGDEFAATLDVPLVVSNRVVLPRHADARVRLVQATSAGRMSGRSELKLELVSVTADGQTYPLETDYYDEAGASRSTRTAEAVGGGAVLGGLLGAIAGRGRGAAIGSVAGAGTGAAVEARTHGQQVKIPSETKLSFTLKNPVIITLNSGAGSQPSTTNPGAGSQPSAPNPGGAPLPSAANPPPSAD